jgi:mRNA-degrading endonuclease YafQ of YafQ-DinJ toxin-antitoxin module
VTSEPRWQPDTNLVEVVLTSPRAPVRMTDLPTLDRAWLVAGLSETVLGPAGLTAEQIADRTGCCLRLVRSIRAEDATKIAEYALVHNRDLEDSLRQEKIAHTGTKRDLAEARREVERLRGQLEQIVKGIAEEKPIPKCYRGHALVDDNVYRHGGRDYCRECNRENTVAYRKRKHAERQRHSVRMSHPVHAAPVASAS